MKIPCARTNPNPVLQFPCRELHFSFLWCLLMSRSEKGLENSAGQNNCFLNVVIQGLWHIDAFRNNFAQLEQHRHNDKACVFCALKVTSIPLCTSVSSLLMQQVIFTQFEFSETDTLPPTALRQSLHELFQQQSRFQLGELDDAAEALVSLHVHHTMHTRTRTRTARTRTRTHTHTCTESDHEQSTRSHA